MTPDLLPRNFAAKLRVETSGCWIFTGAVQSSGYGSIAIDGDGTTRLAHRAAYELLVDRIPAGMTIDHFVCFNKRCCNPAHLEVVTRAENVRRAHANGLYYSPTHCVQGHPRTPDMWRTKKDGRHYCLECQRDRRRRQRFLDLHAALVEAAS